ncbi:MAG TPA: hypothetical protein DCS93_18120 [Microscillaceae bacterium]|nr:hypothetical protein [Microscillaceae bacterium]
MKVMIKFFWILCLTIKLGFAQGQKHEIYPDYIKLNIPKNTKKITFYDNENLVKRTIVIDKNNNVVQDLFLNYYPIRGHYKIDGIYSYKYRANCPLPHQQFYTNSKGDTNRTFYQYSKEGFLKRRTFWKYERRSKLRKGAPKYGDGTLNGCIPREEDLIWYRKWVIRQKKKYKYREGKLVKMYIPYSFTGGENTWELSYNTNGQIVEKKEFGYRKRSQHWVEKFQYLSDKKIINRKYLTKYLDKVPPERSYIYQNKKGKLQSLKIVFKDRKEIDETEYFYKENLLIRIKRIRFGEVLFDYRIKYTSTK